MAYCRWSSDDYQCDVYVYEDCSGGWTVHVAGNRVTPDTPPPPSIGAWWARGDSGVSEFVARTNAVDAWLATGERKAIDLPHAGETFNDPTPEACAERLKELRAIGFNVPQYAIDALINESMSDDENTAEWPVA